MSICDKPYQPSVPLCERLYNEETRSMLRRNCAVMEADRDKYRAEVERMHTEADTALVVVQEECDKYKAMAEWALEYVPAEVIGPEFTEWANPPEMSDRWARAEEAIRPIPPREGSE